MERGAKIKAERLKELRGGKGRSSDEPLCGGYLAIRLVFLYFSETAAPAKDRLASWQILGSDFPCYYG